MMASAASTAVDIWRMQGSSLVGIAHLENRRRAELTAVAMSPDGSFVAFGDIHGVQCVKLRDVVDIEAELERMKKMAVHIYEEMLYMRTRSDQQHATNASTRGRLLWVEVVMMFVVLLMGLWQIRYLRNYFKQKKVI